MHAPEEKQPLDKKNSKEANAFKGGGKMSKSSKIVLENAKLG